MTTNPQSPPEAGGEAGGLLPCPFCGGIAADIGDVRAHKIGCVNNDCEASCGPYWSHKEGRGLAKAIELWNTRARPPTSVDAVREVVPTPHALINYLTGAIVELDRAAFSIERGDHLTTKEG